MNRASGDCPCSLSVPIIMTTVNDHGDFDEK